MKIEVGAKVRGHEILELKRLQNGWILIKTVGMKRPGDYRVKVITQELPRLRSVTPKHAHFVIDFYGKLCADAGHATLLFDSLISVWNGNPADEVNAKIRGELESLPGYSSDYVLPALEWILGQEDINFNGRPEKKQRELDLTLGSARVEPLPGRLGSELAISLFCNVKLGMHPVEAFLRAQLDVNPVKLSRGRV